MDLSIKRQSHIHKILIAGLGPSLAGDLYSTMTLWESSCGAEWTVNRLKALNTAAKQLKGGNFDVADEIYRDNGIAYNKRTHIVKGPFGVVISRLLEAQRPSVLRRLFAVLRVYTCMHLASVSVSQVEKSRKAISGASVATLRHPVRFGHGRFDTLKELNIKTNVELMKPDLSRLKAFSSYHRKVRSGQGPWVKAVGSMLSSTYIPDSLKDRNPCEDVREALVSAGAENNTPGVVTFLQEGGAKARVVAIPNVWCQWLFEPLHRRLDSIVRSLPLSAVHDQSRGAYYLQSNIGKPMWCYDLSSATDRFPRSLQMQVLEVLGYPDYAEALDEISKGNWDFLDESISYSVGQPMGLYGSFPLFHLTHYFVLHDITRTLLGVNYSTSRPFMVLGDDVIINHPGVASKYEEVMTSLGVELSPTKSIHSSDVGEFAGFLAVRTNKGSCVHRPYKFGNKGIKNPLSLLHSLGANVRYLGPYWTKMFDIFVRTLESREPDLTPLVREERDVSKRHKLDSYYLGALVTRISYDIEFEMPYLSMDIWSRAFQDFLGNKEVTSSGSYAAPLRVQSGASLALPELIDEKTQSVFTRIHTDPLIKALRYAGA